MMNFGFFSDMCEPGWNHSCDALIILGFLFSLLVIILVPTVPFIYTQLRGQVLVCCNKCEGVFRLNIFPLALMWYSRF